MTAKIKFRVLSPLLHDGKRYEIGAAVDLSPDQAEALVAGGTVKAAEPAVPAEAPKK